MKMKVLGHRVLVKCDKLEDAQAKELSKFEGLKSSGFEIASKDRKREEQSLNTGVIVDIGPNAWKVFDDGHAWAKVGDRVHFCRHGGWYFEHDGFGYRVLNDEDLLLGTEEAA